MSDKTNQSQNGHNSHQAHFEKVNEELTHIKVPPSLMTPWMDLQAAAIIEDKSVRQMRTRAEKGLLPPVDRDGHKHLFSTEAYFRSLDARLAAAQPDKQG